VIKHTKPNKSCIPGFWEIEEDPDVIPGDRNIISRFNVDGNGVLMIHDFLSDKTCNILIKMFNKSKIQAPVSVNGLKDEVLGIGSKRATGWSENIANKLTKLILPYLPKLYCNELTATDWWQDGKHKVWNPVAISPMLRFMRYEKDSEHYAHYDAGYFYDDNIHRTLKSFVLYLTTNNTGSTRFINDNQEKIPVWDRDHNDWSRRVNNDEILLESFPKKGKLLIFNHRLCHDVEQYDGQDGDRIIIRGDIIYGRY